MADMIKVRGRSVPREKYTSFWRCGIEWPSAIEGKVCEVSSEQLKILKAEPQLFVEVLEPERRK